MNNLSNIINKAYEERAVLTQNVPNDVRNAVVAVLDDLDNGRRRVASPIASGGWEVHEWLKKAILLSFRLFENTVSEGGYTRYYDKVALKYAQADEEIFKNGGARVVPPATVRRGAYIADNVVLMPSYVNIGAYVDSGTMVDTWATVGSCAQIGKNVHISGGAGIGGVLEPLQETPTIIEDNCFIGARSEVVEGVVVGHDSVLSMGVFIGKSTRIYDRASGKISYAYVPPGSVVVPGSLPAKDGTHSLNCAIIVKTVDEKTRRKTAINELLRAE